ncbi:MAG: sulfate transporter family protein [Roseiarcus sp.]|jgi:CysZ protein
MFQDAFDSFADVFSRPFRRVMAKSLALTAAALLLAWLGLHRLALSLVHVGPPWLATTISLLFGVGLLVALMVLAAPVASLAAGFFLDEIAAHVEREIDPEGPPGRPAAAREAAMFALRFAGLSLLVNLVAFALLFVPGLGVVAWIGANGYLIGREYFELAAMRFRPAQEARAMRRSYAIPVFAHGLLIAGFVAVPVLNLFTPLFATALMVRLHARLA